ncbi:MFS transporter, partial [Proteus mirabilis]
LATALAQYKDRLGTAGALLGLFYYLLIGGGLALSPVDKLIFLFLIFSKCYKIKRASYKYNKLF